MAFIDCNEQKNARKSVWTERPHCEHGEWYSNGAIEWRSPKSSRKYQRTTSRNQREERIAFLGGECVNCGSEDDLEFDHTNPATKAFDISPLRLSLHNPVLQAELAKCQLLCKLCHQAKTAQEAGQNASAKKNQLDALINQYGSEAA